MATTLMEKKKTKQARARARRAHQKADVLFTEAFKPLEEWDEEELVRGRPKDPRGRFSGPKPTWLNRAIAEEAGRRFQELMRTDLSSLAPKSLKTVEYILDCEEVDRRGRMLVPPSVKLQAATWVVEHLLGKPRQRIEADISVKLQGILAECLVIPDQAAIGNGSKGLSSSRPAIDVTWSEDEDESGPDE